MITFYNQISKSKPNYNQFIKRIRKFIDKQQPQLVFLLTKEWKKQQNYFTYKDIRQGLLDGSLTNSMIKAWQDSYTQFISNHLAPIWEQAMNGAAKQISNKYTSFSFNPTTANIKNWTANHAGELIVQLTDTQAKGINSLIQMVATTGMSVDELARCIRPTIGLYSGQMTANFNYYQSVKNNLLKNNPHMIQSTAIKIASEKALKYAEKQHMYRAMNIARTELAFAYNRGEFESVKQAVQQGYMGHTVKRWITAGDNRVCPICRSLEGEEAELEAEYSIKNKLDGLTPPFHPSCRCCVEYFETEPPNKIIVNNNIVDEATQASAQTFNEVLNEQERNATNKETMINEKYIRSPEYRAKFKNITGNPIVDQKIYELCRRMLEHRSGTTLEDMYLISATTGEVLGVSTNATIDITGKKQVKYNKSILKALKEAKPYSLISLHNHPGSLAPSDGDFMSAYEKKYYLGVIPCHDGKVYIYETPTQKLDISDFNKTFEYYKTTTPSISKAWQYTLEDLSKKYNLHYREL